MNAKVRKIINDPVHGFITIDDPLVFKVISHPWYQRLRRIHQMAFAHLVYPGAVHTRLHHSLGAYHLMCSALTELKSKGVEITPTEETGAKIAILLHDVGHGPFSHALERVLVKGVHHEDISIHIMKVLNAELDGALQTALDIFTNNYPKPFLHQLISGQLDVDRMDYLSRDSFFTGVSEGVIGYDRIIKMLTVHEGELMVEEKGIYSTEKFLVSRRLMYWQVYLHKTVLGAEKLLVKIFERVRDLHSQNIAVSSGSITLDFFLDHNSEVNMEEHLDRFCRLDDFDVMMAIKNWCYHSDIVLSKLCNALVNRKLFKVKLQAAPIDTAEVKEKRAAMSAALGITEAAAEYLIFTGETTNTTYDPTEEKIKILFKDGTVKDISKVDNALIQQSLASPVKKYYICYLGL